VYNITAQYSAFLDTDYSSLPVKFIKTTYPMFVKRMRKWHERSFARKEDNHLICLANTRGGRRRGKNVWSAYGIMLDFDGKVPFTHEDFAKKFEGFSYIAYNTWSSTKETLKYRIYLPTNMAMSAKMYKQVWREVVALLPKGAVDPLPSFANALFYAPCQANEPDATFFHYQEGGVLDVMSALERAWEKEKQLDAERSKRRRAPKRVSSKKLKEALKRICPDTYHVWFRVGCALHHEFGDDGFAIWDEWSRDSKHYDAHELAITWAAIEKSECSNPVTLGTIYHLAGYRRGDLVQLGRLPANGIVVQSKATPTDASPEHGSDEQSPNTPVQEVRPKLRWGSAQHKAA
jgi:hypothetical protein